MSKHIWSARKSSHWASVLLGSGYWVSSARNGIVLHLPRQYEWLMGHSLKEKPSRLVAWQRKRWDLMSRSFTWNLDLTTFSFFVEFAWLPKYVKPNSLHLKSTNVSESDWDASSQPLLGFHYGATLCGKRIAHVTIFRVCEACELAENSVSVQFFSMVIEFLRPFQLTFCIFYITFIFL